MTDIHTTTVDYDARQRFPWRITCNHGCELRGYVAEHAAQSMAQYHTETGL